MNAQDIAQTIAEYLNDRDDVAEARVVETHLDSGVVSGMIETQGGELYAFSIERA